jgi:predicted thioesterase
MKNPFAPGVTREYRIEVTEDKLARFEAGLVHPVYATFALAQDAEWAGRLFVLEMLEQGEEGIGSALRIAHRSPAVLGATVVFTARFEAQEGSAVHTSFEAHAIPAGGGEPILVATGTQTQHILPRTRIDQMMNRARKAQLG